MNALVVIGALSLILAAAIFTYISLQPSRGRHSNTLGPAHTGAGDGPSPELEYGWPLDTPAARAAIVDLTAALRQDAIDAVIRRDLNHARTLSQHAARLESVLRRWDTTVGVE
jgi:hypothetical protein